MVGAPRAKLMENVAVADISTLDSNLSDQPIDLVEALATAHGWSFERCNEAEIAIRLSGQWCDLRYWFAWRPDISSLFVSCALDTKIPKPHRDAVWPLLARINERLWLGHFELWADDGWPTFRYTLLSGNIGPIGTDILEEVIDAARAECDRYYPAFQFVMWGGEDADGAIAASLIETQGEA